MIEFVGRSGPPEAQSCPAFICDGCRQQVVGSGNIIYFIQVLNDENQPRRQSPLYVGHKGKCDRTLETWLQQFYPAEEHWVPLWEEIGDFAQMLVKNTQRAFADDPHGEYRQHIVIFPSASIHDEVPAPSLFAEK